MLDTLLQFLNDQTGAAAAEYVLILSIAGSALALGAFYFGTKVKDAMIARGDAVEACGTSSTSC